jgi:phosphatidylinositol 4-kinase
MTAPVTSRAYGTEAAAANKAWSALSRNPALGLNIDDEDIKQTIRGAITYAMQCFSDLLCQIEEMDTDPNLDTYAWETMSESLVRTTHS